MALRLGRIVTYPLVAFAALGAWLEGLTIGKRRIPFDRHVAAGIVFWGLAVLITLRVTFGV